MGALGSIMNSITYLSAAGAIAIAATLAPGASRADDEVASAASSSACFDQGLYAKGAVVDYDTKISGDSPAPVYRTVNTGKGTAKFEGKTANAVESETFDSKGKSEGVVTGYYDFAPGFLLILGTEAKDFKSVFDPAGRQPIDQEKGDRYKQKYKMITTAKDVGTQTVDRQAVWKFAGTESLKTKLGKFTVCKITAKFTDKIAPGFSTVTNLTTYVAASGKYRGFTLRTKTSGKAPTGQPINITADVVKVRKFQPK